MTMAMRRFTLTPVKGGRKESRARKQSRFADKMEQEQPLVPRNPIMCQKPIRILLMGDTQVGKTEIVRRLLNLPFRHQYMPTPGCVTTAFVKTYDKQRTLEVVDIGADGRYAFLPVVRHHSILNCDVIIFCFSLTDVASFHATTRYYNMIPELWHGTPFPVYLVGTKSDLKAERQVQTKAGKSKAALWGCEYKEVSCLKGDSVNELLFKIYIAVMDYRPVAEQYIEEHPGMGGIRPMSTLTAASDIRLTKLKKEREKNEWGGSRPGSRPASAPSTPATQSRTSHQ